MKIAISLRALQSFVINHLCELVGMTPRISSLRRGPFSVKAANCEPFALQSRQEKSPDGQA